MLQIRVVVKELYMAGNIVDRKLVTAEIVADKVAVLIPIDVRDQLAIRPGCRLKCVDVPGWACQLCHGECIDAYIGANVQDVTTWWHQSRQVEKLCLQQWCPIHIEVEFVRQLRHEQFDTRCGVESDDRRPVDRSKFPASIPDQRATE